MQQRGHSIDWKRPVTTRGHRLEELVGMFHQRAVGRALRLKELCFTWNVDDDESNSGDGEDGKEIDDNSEAPYEKRQEQPLEDFHVTLENAINHLEIIFQQRLFIESVEEEGHCPPEEKTYTSADYKEESLLADSSDTSFDEISFLFQSTLLFTISEDDQEDESSDYDDDGDEQELLSTSNLIFG